MALKGQSHGISDGILRFVNKFFRFAVSFLGYLKICFTTGSMKSILIALVIYNQPVPSLKTFLKAL